MFRTTVVWGLAALLVVACIILVIIVSTKRFQDYNTWVFARRVGLQINSEATFNALRRRSNVTSIGGLAGVFVGILVAAAALLINPQPGLVSYFWTAAVPIILGFTLAGELVAALRETLFTRDTTLPRFARPRATGPADYVSRHRRMVAAALLAVATVTNAAAVALGVSGSIDAAVYFGSAALPLLAVGAVAYVGGIVAERLVLRTPQPAADPAELAWSDAFVAETLRSIRMTVAVVIWISVASAGVGLLAGVDAMHGTSWSTDLGPLLFTWGYLALIIVFSTRGAQQYYLRRLWPQVLSGTPAPVRAVQS